MDYDAEVKDLLNRTRKLETFVKNFEQVFSEDIDDSHQSAIEDSMFAIEEAVSVIADSQVEQNFDAHMAESPMELFENSISNLVTAVEDILESEAGAIKQELTDLENKN